MKKLQEKEIRKKMCNSKLRKLMMIMTIIESN